MKPTINKSLLYIADAINNNYLKYDKRHGYFYGVGNETRRNNRMKVRITQVEKLLVAGLITPEQYSNVVKMANP